MRIGNLTIENRIVLAPMAGITDIVFRRLCRRFGAAIVYSEFLSSDGLALNKMSQKYKLTLADDEHPVAYQLFGSRTETFGGAARRLAEYKPDLIDLNFGCPVKKVVKNNGGSAVLRDLDLMAQIIRETCKAVPLPVTVKMRAGWDHDNLVYRDAAQLAVEAGAKAITLHARTRADTYETAADWSYIAELRPLIKVPLIGNGDVDSADRARQMLDETGCDAVMIGRAALGRPWIFAEINHFLKTGEHLPTPRLEDRFSVAWGHLTAKVRTMKRESAAIRLMRKPMAAYFRGLPDANLVRRRLMTLETLDAIRELMADYAAGHRDTDGTEGNDWIGDYIPLERDWLQRPLIIT